MTVQMLLLDRREVDSSKQCPFVLTWYLWNYGFGYILVVPQAKALMFSFPPRKEIQLQNKKESIYIMRIKNQDSDPVVSYAKIAT